MKQEWTLYFAASTTLLALYIVLRFALDRGAAGETTRANPFAVVTACTPVPVPTLLFATLVNRGWRYGPVISSRGGWAFAAVTVVSVWGAALASRNAPFAQIYAIPELFIALAYRRAFVVAAVMNFGLVAAQALGGEPTPDNFSKWAVAAIATVTLAGLFGKPIDLLAETNVRNQKLVEQLQAHNAQIARLSHLEGAMRERERIVREMHDTIVQGLASILALARAAAAEVARAGGAEPSAVNVTQAGNAAASTNGVEANHQASQHLAMTVGLAQEGLDDTHRMTTDASLRALDGRGLAEAVGRAADRLEREGTAVVRSLDSTLSPLPRPAKVAILRIAQRAITNVARHSQATNVAVSLRSVAGMAVLEIRNDGVGFNPTTAGAVDAGGGSSSSQTALRGRPESADEGQADLVRVRHMWRRGRLGHAPERDDPGFRIPNMRDRVVDLGGSVSIDSSPGSGTRVFARIPVEAPTVEDVALAGGPTSRGMTSQVSQEAADSALQGEERE